MALTALPTVGIAGIGLYIPEPIVTGAEIAARTGLPEFVVRDKMGIQQVHVAGQDDTITAMSVRAAERALADAELDAKDLDLIILSSRLDRASLERAWFYFPRILHPSTRVFREQVAPNGERILRRVEHMEITRLSEAVSTRRAA